MTWYHGTVLKRFEPGDVVEPGNRVGRFGNFLMNPNVSPVRTLASGRVTNMHDVVWICGDVDEAASWASHSLLKALPSEIRRSPAGGIAVYEVDPTGLELPADEPHSPTEAACEKARVVREVLFEAFPQDECDGGCGERATVNLGSDEQLCADCAAREAAATSC